MISDRAGNPAGRQFFLENRPITIPFAGLKIFGARTRYGHNVLGVDTSGLFQINTFFQWISSCSYAC